MTDFTVIFYTVQHFRLKKYIDYSVKMQDIFFSVHRNFNVYKALSNL